jgi:hypothetical protein
VGRLRHLSEVDYLLPILEVGKCLEVQSLGTGTTECSMLRQGTSVSNSHIVFTKLVINAMENVGALLSRVN